MSLLIFASAAQASDSPHGRPDQCVACHTETDTEISGLRQPIVPLCRSCHPNADMHPVGIAPQHIQVPPTWPLEQGRLTCATCHQEPAHATDKYTGHAGESINPTRPWHRGGPYSTTSDLCYQCHTRTEYSRQDPHHPHDDRTCTACHTKRPAEGAAPDAAALRLEGTRLCGSCHADTQHVGMDAHMGKTMDSPPAALAFAAGNTVACWTCHDVHQHSALPGPSTASIVENLQSRARNTDWAQVVPQDATWPGQAPADHPPMLALPLAEGELCRACHGSGP